MSGCLCVVRFAARKIIGLCVSYHWSLVHKRSSPSLPLRVALATAPAVYKSHGRLGAARHRCAAARCNASLRALCNGAFLLAEKNARALRGENAGPLRAQKRAQLFAS